LEGETVFVGVLDSVELGASSSGGGILICDTNLEAVKEDTKESKNLDVLEVAVLEEPFSFFKEPGVSVGLGDSVTIEQFVNQIVEDSLTDLIPSYKEVLSQTPIQIFSGGKTLYGSCPKTKPENRLLKLLDGGIKRSYRRRKGLYLGV
jgi:hypothetical protein